ncbi:hypothetical protein [Burkholderia ubonensis]|uniref:hypothetical protein n=1 Tax=Burkholderia ubonensis TaxID=101571 RepID=UPI000A5E3FE7|nr:hypothetical protein [Burkholderia ubonensis]
MTPPDQNATAPVGRPPAPNERPGNRPPGAPRQAVIAGGAFFLGVGLSFAELVEGAASLQTVAFDDLFMPAWVVLAIIMLTVSIGIGSGKLWAVRMFRWLSFGAMALYLPLLALACYLNAGRSPIDPDLAFVMFVFAVVKLPCLIIIYRAIRRLRWLDPDSLPHEWEPPLRQR